MSEGGTRKGTMRFGAESAMALAVVVVILMILIPLPMILLDFFLALQLSLALMILLLSLVIRKVSDFSTFPTVLLLATVLCLALNISSTRLILLRGSEFDGKLIRAFGSFVAGEGMEGIVVGSLIFVIIIAVQLIVITKGSGRIAEVAARFALDALPGRQMSIDSELNAGTISPVEASGRKAELRREADFYGQMDGASKFVAGNAKVSILITLVDILGGFLVGTVIHGEDFATAISTYSLLTIGDGLSSQLPALLISVAAGIVVTRVNSGNTFAVLVQSEFGSRKGIFVVTGAVLALMAALPGFPWYILLPLAAAFAYTGLSGEKKPDGTAIRPASPGPVAAASADFPIAPGSEGGNDATRAFSSIAPPDPFCLELGYGLVPIALGPKDSGGTPSGVPESATSFLDLVTEARKRASLEAGVPVPPLRIVDSSRLPNYAYAIRIRGDKVAGGILKPGRLLAIPAPEGPESLPPGTSGVSTRDPVSGANAFWIPARDLRAAEAGGFIVLGHERILLAALLRSMRNGMADFLGRQEVSSLVEDLRKDYPAVVQGLLAAHSLGDVQRVLQILLREDVSIRNTVGIFETLADHKESPGDHVFLAEKARQSLGRQIWLACLARQEAKSKRVDAVDGEGAGVLDILTLSPALERDIAAAMTGEAAAREGRLDQEKESAILDAVNAALEISGRDSSEAVVVCAARIRPALRNLTKRRFPGLTVLSSGELPPEARTRQGAEISPGDYDRDNADAD